MYLKAHGMGFSQHTVIPLRLNQLGSFLLTRIHLNRNMDKYLYAL